MKKKSSHKKKIKFPLVRIAAILLFANLVFLCVTVFLFFLVYLTLPKPIEDVSPSPVHFSYFVKMPEIQAFSKALVVYDVNSKVILLSKNQNLRFSPASTAKIMTALVALEHYDPKTVLTVNVLPKNQDSSKMGLLIGEKITVLNLLYGMLLPSGSDAADVLASNYPGGVKAFVMRMNEKAKSLNLFNTHFVDPSGYGDDNYTTAYDLSHLAVYALSISTLADIVKTREITVYTHIAENFSIHAEDESNKSTYFSSNVRVNLGNSSMHAGEVDNTDYTITHVLQNLNELLIIPGVTGMKTGFTNEAQGVLVTTFLNNNHSYVIVVLGSKDRFQDTRALIEGIIKDLRLDAFNN